MSGDVTRGYLQRMGLTVNGLGDLTVARNLTVTGTATFTGAISENADITLATGKAIQTDTTTAHTALFKAYDVDGTSYKTFATLTNGNTPSFAIAAPSGGTVAIDGATIGGVTPAAGTFTTLIGTTIDGIIGSVTPAAITGTTITSSSNTSTGGYTAKSGTAVPATAGAIAAGAPITMFSTGIKIWVTSDTPTHSATKGDLCLNTGGSSTSTRLFINNGTTAWVAITTAS